MSRSTPGCDAVDNSTPSTKRVNWEIGGDEIVNVLIHAAALGQKPGQIITHLIRTHLNDFSVTDQRKVRETRARNRAAKVMPTGSANLAAPQS